MVEVVLQADVTATLALCEYALRIDDDAMQMACIEGSPQAAFQIYSQISEAEDALRQHMLPCIGLRDIIQLAGTCRAWHQLMMDTPLHQLSEEAHRAVLPLGLTSSLLLLQHVKQQAQLLARLRGKHGFAPGIQHLSFRDHSLDGSRHGNAQQSNVAPQLEFDEMLWSPCDCSEDASRWLALQSSLQGMRLPTVVDLETGRQVCTPEDPSAMLVAPGDNPWNHAAWLTDKPDRMLFFRVSGTSHGPIACLTDAHGQGSLPLFLPCAQHCGYSRFLTVCGKDGSAVDVLCLQSSNCDGPSDRAEDPISVVNVFSRQLLYQLRCPDQLHQCSRELQREANSQYQPAPGEIQFYSPTAYRVLLAPNKQLLAVVWQCHVRQMVRSHVELGSRMGLSIHSATTGGLEHSRILGGGTRGPENDCQPGWLPCSSNFMYVGEGSTVHLMTSAGCMLWSNAWADRHPNLPKAEHVIVTDLSASPCGRWILVADLPASGWGCVQGGGMVSIWQIAILEASTGRTLTAYLNHARAKITGSWSTSGDLCLLEELALVCRYSPQAYPNLQTFQPYQLLGRAASDANALESSISFLGPSPCGSTVVGDCAGLQHWRIPPTSTLVKEAPSAANVLQPFSLAESTQPKWYTKHSMHKAWQPLHGTSIYAIFCAKGVLHLIDAKAHSHVRSWSRDELHGPATPSDPGQDDISSVYEHLGQDPDDRFLNHQLSWSPDGRRLAIVSDASARCGARCSVLHFSDRSI